MCFLSVYFCSSNQWAQSHRQPGWRLKGVGLFIGFVDHEKNIQKCQLNLLSILTADCHRTAPSLSMWWRFSVQMGFECLDLFYFSLHKSYLWAGAGETANLHQSQHRCVLTSYVTERLGERLIAVGVEGVYRLWSLNVYFQPLFLIVWRRWVDIHICHRLLANCFQLPALFLSFCPDSTCCSGLVILVRGQGGSMMLGSLD